MRIARGARGGSSIGSWPYISHYDIGFLNRHEFTLCAVGWCHFPYECVLGSIGPNIFALVITRPGIDRNASELCIVGPWPLRAAHDKGRRVNCLSCLAAHCTLRSSCEKTFQGEQRLMSYRDSVDAHSLLSSVRLSSLVSCHLCTHGRRVNYN